MKALESFLRPEFINRVDEIVYFNKLTEDNFKAIAAIMLRELQDALKEKGITFTWDDALLDYLVKKSYSMTYGAAICAARFRKDLEDDIATKLIEQLPPSHPEHPMPPPTESTRCSPPNKSKKAPRPQPGRFFDYALTLVIEASSRRVRAGETPPGTDRWSSEYIPPGYRRYAPCRTGRTRTAEPSP